MTTRHSISVRRGFTLIELVAAMTVVAAIGSVMSVIMTTAVDGYTRAATTAQLNSEIGVALDRINQVLRVVPGAVDDGPTITNLTATSVTWNTNWSLSLTGTNLMLTEAGGSSSILLKDVSALSISAFNESNSALGATLSGSACAPIQRLRISITQTRNGVSEVLRTRIFIRSLLVGGEG